MDGLSGASLGVDPVLSRNAAADAAMVRAKSNLSAKKLNEIDEAAKNFESMFVSEMIGNMFNSVEVDPEFGGGQAEETWRGLLAEEYGKQVVKSGGIGLSDDIKAKMIEIQEANQK